MKRGSGGDVNLSSMEFIPNEIEMKNLANNPITELCENGKHYRLNPQRGCFLRCMDCLNLSEAESRQSGDGKWHFSTECYFCVQRVIDLLGYYEHGVVPQLVVSGDKKTRAPQELDGIYAAIYNSVKQPKENTVDVPEVVEPISDVFDDCVGGDT